MTPGRNSQPLLRLIGLGEMAPGEHRFDGAQIAVGSGGDNDFVIAHPTVSRKHAMIRREGGGYHIEDLASTNGTFVNRRRIQQPVRLQPGDEIGFGATKFAFARRPDDAAPAPPRRGVAKMLAPVAGIIVFAIVGFVAARYLFNPQRSILTRPLVEPPQSTVSVPRGSETSAPAAQSSSEETESAEPSASEDESSAEPLWLQHLNEFRASAGLAPVSSDPNLSDGDHKHAVYIVKNFASRIMAGEIGAEVHTEDVHLPWYTPQGAAAAPNSDVAEQGASPGHKVPDPQQWAIDGWITAPFHRLFILSPLLHSVGFGFDCENNFCVAVLNVLSDAEAMPRFGAPLERPILYPPDGGTIPAAMRTLDSEWPTPISGCDGYAFPTGIPVTVQLGPNVDAQLDSFTVTAEDGTALDACGFDANSYRNPSEDDRARVVSNLRGQGAVVIVPRQPLDPGARYDVLATINGRDYKWSFSVAR
jgi:pSer/pThr/pTyr-binding forkhead associated (FHA) protein